MSKADELLKALQDHIGEWTCAYCGSNSGQPAATFRELKKRGYSFEEIAPNQWGKALVCPHCGESRTHYKLLEQEPVFQKRERINMGAVERKRILALLNNRDAFTGATISSVAEIDHKVPWSRLDRDIEARSLSDDEIKIHFQLLTREHNLLKDRACGDCKTSNVRPPLFEIGFWYEGDERYQGTCVGCGWYDGAKWRSEINKKF